MRVKSKIVSVKTLKTKIISLRKKKEKVVFTNGCFDILHFGHVSYLQEAKRQGDVLVLGLNSDVSVHLIKGKKRPIVSQDQRAYVLAALECIDWIVIFDEDTPYKLIKSIKPDVLVKGADWKGKTVAGSDVVKESGGKVKYINFVKGCSTTSIINSILKKCS